MNIMLLLKEIKINCVFICVEIFFQFFTVSVTAGNGTEREDASRSHPADTQGWKVAKAVKFWFVMFAQPSFLCRQA